MKKELFLVPAVIFTLFSCGKKAANVSDSVIAEVNNTAEIEMSVPEHDFPEETLEIQEKKIQYIPVVMLWENGALWLENNSGIMKWANIELPMGTVLDGCIKENTKEVEIKTAKRDSSGNIEDREFAHVVYQNKDYWVQTALITIDATPAIISSEGTFMYNAPQMTGMSSTQFPVGTIVAVYNEEVADKNFVRVDVKTNPNYIDIRGKYIKADKIVSNPDDVQVLQLISLAKKTKNEAVRNELLLNAKSFSPSDTVKKIFSDYEESLHKEAVPEVKEEPYEIFGHFDNEKGNIQTGDSDPVNVRSKPGVKSEVVGKLYDGASIIGSDVARTEGPVDLWIFIKALDENGAETGLEGWVAMEYTTITK